MAYRCDRQMRSTNAIITALCVLACICLMSHGNGNGVMAGGAQHDEAALAILAEHGHNVLDLNDGNFDKTLLSLAPGEGMFVEFFAPWCGHCVHAAPLYAQAATKLLPRKTAKVDCVAQRGLCTRFGIRGFPTFKYVRLPNSVEQEAFAAIAASKAADPNIKPIKRSGLKVYDYENERSIDKFVEYVTEEKWTSDSKYPVDFPEIGETLEPSVWDDVVTLLTTSPLMLAIYIVLAIGLIAGFWYIVWDAITMSREEKKRAEAKKARLAKQEAAKAAAAAAAAAAGASSTGVASGAHDHSDDDGNGDDDEVEEADGDNNNDDEEDGERTKTA